jgi:hypothetical protein
MPEPLTKALRCLSGQCFSGFVGLFFYRPVGDVDVITSENLLDFSYFAGFQARFVHHFQAQPLGIFAVGAATEPGRGVYASLNKPNSWRIG